MEKEKLSKRIYDYLNLDKRLNRYLFIFGVFFGYFMVFYFLPIFIEAMNIIDKQKMGLLTNINQYNIEYFYPLFSSFGKLFSVLITQPFNFLAAFVFIFFGVWANILHLTDNFVELREILFYYVAIAPFLILIPSIIIHKILPKFKIIYLILLGGGAIVISNIYI